MHRGFLVYSPAEPTMHRTPLSVSYTSQSADELWRISSPFEPEPGHTGESRSGITNTLSVRGDT
jgi:hypothetical protein